MQRMENGLHAETRVALFSDQMSSQTAETFSFAGELILMERI